MHVVGKDARVLGATGAEYVVGTNRSITGVRINLPPGKWRVMKVDLMSLRTKELAQDAAGAFAFSAPDSRAVLTHFLRTDGR